MGLMSQGTLLFRAKWTAKEVYIHTHAFGFAAGTRYAMMRLRELQQRRSKPWISGGPVPPGMDATLLLAPGLEGLMPWGAPVLEAGSNPRSAADLIPLVRTVVFSGRALPPNAKALLKSCRAYSVTVVYIYDSHIPWRNRIAHVRLLSSSQTALCLLGVER